MKFNAKLIPANDAVRDACHMCGEAITNEPTENVWEVTVNSPETPRWHGNIRAYHEECFDTDDDDVVVL